MSTPFPVWLEYDLVDCPCQYLDKEAKIQGQVDANAAAILKAHDEGKSVKELYKRFGIDRGLFCDLVYIVLTALWDTGLQRQRPECLKISLYRWYIEAGWVNVPVLER
jgi:hypothetical protein